MPKVSVIIPVYNTAPYLRRCLDSVISQTLRDIEIICVNDGSTDESGEILREYAAIDNRIMIIDFKENRGVSVARNVGIEAVRGEYIGFVDSDDWVDLDFYEKLYAKAIGNEADIAKGNMRYFEYDGTASIKNINDKIKYNRMAFQWQFTTAIFRSIYITAENIRFPKAIFVGEDANFLVRAVFYANMIILSDDVCYNYIRRIDSADSKVLPYDKVVSVIHARYILLEFINFVEIDKNEYTIVFNHIFDDVFALIHKNDESNCISTIANYLAKMYFACKLKENISHAYVKYMSKFFETGNEHGMILYLEKLAFMKRVLISIIIPVYNVEPYLACCLDSVIEQTYWNIEIICVDDKSTDGSCMMLREYEINDARI
jgi:glycosyltransferase involved in cell wall biosynthesis